MIKINLLRNLGLDPGGGGGEAVSANAKRDAILKIVVVLLAPALMIIYERMNTGTLNAELNDMEQKIQAIEAEMQQPQYRDLGPLVQEYTASQAKLEKQLEVVRGIATNRFREVQALDRIQTLLPSHVWASEISIKGNTINFRGLTSSASGVSDIIEILQSSTYFSKVETKPTRADDTSAKSTQRFEIEFMVGQ